MAPEKFLDNMGSCSAEQAPQALYSWGGGSKTAFWTPCVVNVGIGFTGVDGKRLKAAVLDHHLKIFKINLNHYSMDGVCLTSIVKSWIELVYAVIGGI